RPSSSSTRWRSSSFSRASSSWLNAPSHASPTGSNTPLAKSPTGEKKASTALRAESSGPEPRKSRVRRVTGVSASRRRVKRERPERRERATVRARLARHVGREEHALQRLELLERLARADGDR